MDFTQPDWPPRKVGIQLKQLSEEWGLPRAAATGYHLLAGSDLEVYSFLVLESRGLSWVPPAKLGERWDVGAFASPHLASDGCGWSLAGGYTPQCLSAATAPSLLSHIFLCVLHRRLRSHLGPTWLLPATVTSISPAELCLQVFSVTWGHIHRSRPALLRGRYSVVCIRRQRWPQVWHKLLKPFIVMVSKCSCILLFGKGTVARAWGLERGKLEIWP